MEADEVKEDYAVNPSKSAWIVTGSKGAASVVSWASLAYLVSLAGPVSAGPHPFGPGEQLTYALKVAGMKAANLDLACYESAPRNGQPAYRLEGILKTTTLVKWTYLVDDRMETVVLADSLSPVKSEMWIEEGAFRKHHKQSFQVKPLGPRTHDVLSFWYALRTAPLAIGYVAKLKIWSEKELVDLPLIVRDTREIKSGVGKRPCFFLEPVNQLTVNGRPLTFSVAISNDVERLPVMFQGKTAGLSVSALLASAKRPAP